MLPEESKYDYLAELPESKDIAEAINTAMRLIEAEYPDLAGILPKSATWLINPKGRAPQDFRPSVVYLSYHAKIQPP